MPRRVVLVVFVVLGLAVSAAVALLFNPFDRGLMEAVKRGDVETARAVVSSWNVNETDRWGFTPLMHAAIRGDYRTCELLLENGADRTRTDLKWMRTALDSVNRRLGVGVISKEDQEFFDSQGIKPPAPPYLAVGEQRTNLLKVKALLESK